MQVNLDAQDKVTVNASHHGEHVMEDEVWQSDARIIG